MAEIVSNLVKPAMEELGTITLVKIKHLFTYLFCFNSNIQSLRDEAKKLEDARAGLQRQVEAAENDAQVILPEVKTWLENASNKIQVDKSGIDDQIPTLKNGCWRVKSRYQLSRKAVKLTTEMKLLTEDRNKFNDISTPPLPAAQAEIPLGTTYEFQSRKQIEAEIMEALRAKEVTTVGICGMGGVGKTTMAKRIMDRVKKENIFQEIFMVVVSQQVDVLKIQTAIAESLGLELHEETSLARATKLRARLTGEKRILIVFDDVWQKLKLEDLGIPCGNECCTILFTSRNKDMLGKMDVQKVYGVEILSETEAWFLFRQKIGSCVDDPNLISIAKEVARECKCLPIALITVSGALKDQTRITFWEDALQQLKSFNPEDIPSFIKDVYNPLKLSFTNLESRHAKSLFLLCSLFPEDVDISLEELTSYCLGLRMFPDLDVSNAPEGILEIVRRRVFTIVDMLKNRFLLLNGGDEHHVKMHDVVRDVAIYIASNEANEGIVDVKFNSIPSPSEYTCHWVSVFSEQTSNLLRMNGPNSGRKLEIKDFSIFKGIKEVNLLSFQYISLKSIPLKIQLLKNLRTLRLVDCKLESFPAVGKLLSLEILDCHDCVGIVELPVEIGNLNQLKRLDFSRCRGLRSIPPGVISNLVELEEFKMLGSFSGWELAEVQGRKRRGACLNEFENLSKLTCLEIEIYDFNLAAEEICFSPNILRYHIGIGGIDCVSEHDYIFHAKGMSVRLPSDISLGSWVLRFLRSADNLYSRGLDLKSLDLPQAHNMKSLKIEDCCTIKELVHSTTSIDDRSKFDVFPILKGLHLSNLPNLEAIYDGPVLDQSNSFGNLQSLVLANLPALKHLWKQRPNRNIVSLDKLREIRIRNCNSLHSLFSFPTCIGTDQISTGRDIDELLCTQKVFFPMLGTLELKGLDNLEVIWNSPISEESNSFKNLENLILSELPAMTCLWRNPNLSVSLNNLSQIRIDGCHKLRSLFSSTMSTDFLLQLTSLDVKNCEMMEQMLLNENQCRTIHFSKLSELTLDSLESLTTFGKGIESIDFPMLLCIYISNCPKLISLLPYDVNNQNSIDDHDEYSSHLFCNQKVSFGSLKMVVIRMEGIRNIWCRQIPTGFFSQLMHLTIEDCTGIRSLFSSSIAENLVNLNFLWILKCKEIVKVIEDDDNILCEKPCVLFPSLELLRLKDLPKLESFCNWRCDLQLPSLKYVILSDCPLMEFFTMKSVMTPNLQRIKMDIHKREMRDLNGAIMEMRFEASQLRQYIARGQEAKAGESQDSGEVCTFL